MLEITRGLADCQVLQRGEDGTASALVEGTCSDGMTGGIEARVLYRGFALPGWDWRAVGDSSGEQWRAHLAGVPCGGPFRIEFRASESASYAPVKEALVGDLWILAGQSNMEGAGNLIDVEPPYPLVHTYGLNEQWELAEEPLHWLCDSPDPVHAEQAEPMRSEAIRMAHASRTKGAGLGLAFAAEVARRTSIPIGLIPCAHGGTSLAQWSPALRDAGGASLYGSLFRRFKAAGGRVRGVLWYQGESDAVEGAVDPYVQRMQDLVRALRRDLNSPTLAFLMVQIGRWIAPAGSAYPNDWNAIQEKQRQLAGWEGVEVVASVDLELDDLIHTGAQGLRRLGRRLANVAFSTVYGVSDRHSGPRLESATLEEGLIRVRYGHVNGRIVQSLRVSGFSLRTGAGDALELIYKAETNRAEPNEVLLHLTEQPPAGAHLWYGCGLDPYCNLADELDLAAPVFGPIPLAP